MVAAPVELWSTTSLNGQPVRIQRTQTDNQGRYVFLVDALSGPRPDFGCYEVRLSFLSSSNKVQTALSQPLCQVPAGGTGGTK